jgi:ABC-type branched-subunit amino acid transport system permease subunit
MYGEARFLRTPLHLELASGYERRMATDTVLSILVLASFALLGGAYVLRRRGGSKRQVTLMVILAFVALANVAIWIVPDSQGNAPIDQSIE